MQKIYLSFSRSIWIFFNFSFSYHHHIFSPCSFKLIWSTDKSFFPLGFLVRVFQELFLDIFSLIFTCSLRLSPFCLFSCLEKKLVLATMKLSGQWVLSFLSFFYCSAASPKVFDRFSPLTFLEIDFGLVFFFIVQLLRRQRPFFCRAATFN